MLSFFNKKKTPGHLTVTLNAKLQPQHRFELEDAFESVCKKQGIGASVDGGGTLMEKTGEVKECDIEITVEDMNEKTVDQIKGIFEAMLAPIGSRITASGKSPEAFGNH